MTHKILFANESLQTVVPQLVEVVHPTCGESPTEGGHLASGGFR